MTQWQGQLTKIDDYRWKIPDNYKTGMRVPGLIYASKEMLESIREEQTPEQVANVAFLPGYSGLLPGYAGHSLGIWLPHRWCSSDEH